MFSCFWLLFFYFVFKISYSFTIRYSMAILFWSVCKFVWLNFNLFVWFSIYSSDLSITLVIVSLLKKLLLAKRNKTHDKELQKCSKFCYTSQYLFHIVFVRNVKQYIRTWTKGTSTSKWGTKRYIWIQKCLSLELWCTYKVYNLGKKRNKYGQWYNLKLIELWRGGRPFKLSCSSRILFKFLEFNSR